MSNVWFYRCRLLASLLVVGMIQRLAPWARADDPAWFELNGLPETRVGLEVEGSSENTRINGVSSTYDTLFITPTVGLRTSGSIYHPNLLFFRLDGELGWGWDSLTTKSPGYKQTINESAELNRYLVEVDLLAAKPYNASFFASKDHTYRDYGSFDTSTVDSSRYGGRVNWNTDNLSLNTDFGYRDEKNTGLTGSSEISESYFDFLGLNKRPSGQTTLTFRYHQFENMLNFANALTSTSESVGISDAETFGHRKQIAAATGASYSQSEYGGQLTRTINANENININHRPNLDSYLLFNFSNSRMHPEESSALQGTVGLRHRLYESLTSTLDLHGSYDDSSSPSSSSATDQYGVGLHEGYTKQLGDWGRLSLGAGVIADHDDQNSSGSVLSVFDEQHNLTNTPAFLNNPQVIASTIQVRAASDNTLYVEGADYTVIPSGLQTGIQLVLGSLNVALHGSQVLVNYQSDSLYNASFEVVNSSAQIRLDLFNRLGIYGRINKLDDNAPPQVLTQTLTDLVAGMDYTWRWLRANAEYENYDSNFTQYQAWRFLQSFGFQLSNASRLGVDLSQNFYRYSGNLNQDQYQFIARYNTQFDFSLAWYVEAGYVLHDMTGTTQDSSFARTGFSWSRGKLSVRAGYEFNYQTTKTGPSKDERDRNYFFMKLKRTF